MQKTTIQVPLTKELRKKAELVSADMGFSSLQETIRVLLTKLAKQELTIRIEDQVEEIMTLSPAAEERYREAVEDAKAGRNIYKPKNKKEFFEMLNS